MSPRKSVVETAATRTRIIERALALASTDGLEPVTIGRLAAELEMSKAGVIGHFGTKEALQLAAVDAAVEKFRARVVARVAGAEPGLGRLVRAFGEWIDYMAEDMTETGMHGGCLLTSLAAEFDGRPGPVRDAVLAALDAWAGFVDGELLAAVASGGLPQDADIDQIAFELNGIALATDQAVQLHRDPRAPDRARRAIDRLLDR